jgi:hypothetical protein
MCLPNKLEARAMGTFVHLAEDIHGRAFSSELGSCRITCVRALRGQFHRREHGRNVKYGLERFLTKPRHRKLWCRALRRNWLGILR